MAVVYIYINKKNGKAYIGQTRNEEERKKAHLKNSSRCWAFRNALMKYGEEGFSYQILADGIEDQSLLNDVESYFIWSLMTQVPKGYNIKNGGSYGTFPDFIRERMSKTHRRHHSDPEWVGEWKEALRKTHSTQEWKDNLRARMENRSLNEVWRKNQKEGLKRAFKGQEIRDKISKRNIERMKNPEVYSKIVERFRQVAKDPEYQRKVRDGRILARLDPEKVLKRTLKMRAKKAITILCTTTGKVYWGGVEAAQELGLKRTNISKVLHGKYNHTHGYHFRYATEEEIANFKREAELQKDKGMEGVR